MDGNNNNLSSEEEFSFLFNVEHSPKRKIRLHKLYLPERKILDAAFSKTHSVVVFSGSLVYAWGLEHFENAFKSNYKNPNSNRYPICVNYLRNKNIIKCAAGNGFSIFLNRDGVVFSCGFGNKGCLGHGDLSNTFTPVIISSILAVNIRQINCGAEHILAVSENGDLFSWGSSFQGQLGQGNVKLLCSPREVFTSAKVHKAFGGVDASVLLLKNGKILVCGSNTFCKIGFPSAYKRLSTFRTLNAIEERIVDVGLNNEGTALLCENGDVILMGKCGSKIYTYPQKIFLPYSNLYTIGLGNNFLAFANDKLVNMIYFNDDGLERLDPEKCNFSHSSNSKLSHCSYSSNKSFSTESTGSSGSKNFSIAKTSRVGKVYSIQNKFFILIENTRN